MLTEMSISTEASRLKRSVMRELLKLAVSPEIISFAGGLPASEFLPVAEFQDCLQTVIARDGASTLQYAPMYRPLQEWIANYMQSRGVDCTPDNILITNGAQQGLNILSRLMLDTGDRAVTEAITFTGVQQVTGGRGARVLTVETDHETGADVEQLERHFKAHRDIRFAIIIPDFQNPQGVSLSLEKRQRIAELAAEYQVPIIEDDPYSALRFAGEALPPIKAFDRGGMVYYVGSFSKMLAPAVRLGWVVVPDALLTKLTALRESFDLESSTLMQRAVAEFLNRGLMSAHLERFAEGNRNRCAAMMQALDTHLGDLAHWTQPQGGLFTWVTLPEHIDAWAMLDAAVKQQVAYIPGMAFAVDGGHHNTLRLNFSNCGAEHIHEGIARLARVIHAQT